MLRHARKRFTSPLVGGLTGLVVVTTALAALPAAATSAPTSDGRVVFVLDAPEGITAQALVRGDGGGIVSRPSGSSQGTVELSLPGGSHSVEPLAATFEGQTWEATSAATTVDVQPGQTTRVDLTWRKVARQVDVRVNGTTGDSIALEWRSDIKNAKYVVRRAVGDTAPATRRDGSAVPVGSGDSVTDAGLRPDTTYSYAVFGRGQFGWQPATTITTATLPVGPDASMTASYSLMPHAIVVKPGDADVPSVVNGELWVKLAPSRPAPVLGAGMAMPISEVLAGGFLGVIVEVSPDGRSVRLEQAGLPDVFSHYKLSTTFEKTVDYDPIVVNNQPSEGSDGGVQARRVSRAASSDNCLDYTALDLELGVDPSITAVGAYDTEIIRSWGVPVAVAADAEVSITAGVEMDMKATKEISCFLGLDNFVVKTSVAPVPTALLWEAGLKFSASGAVAVYGLGATASATFGGRVQIGRDGGFTPAGNDVSGDMLEPTGEGSAEASVGIGGEVTWGPGSGTKDLGIIAGIGGTFDVFKASVEGAFGADEDSSCLKVTGESAGSLRLHAAAFMGPLDTEVEYVLWDGSHEWGSRSWPTDCDLVDPDLGSGDVQATLSWAHGDDLDLHVIDPAGEEISYRNTTSASGGTLDVDMIPGCEGDTSESVENVFWPTGESPSGRYQVWVHEYNDCDSTEGEWTLTIRVEGIVVLRRTGTGTSMVYNFITSEN